jgi:Outer membrane protein beta-barrel domain
MKFMRQFSKAATAILIMLLLGMGSIQAQTMHKGNFVIDGYYGFPNLTTSALKLLVREVYDSPDLVAKGIGPFGGRAQYMVTDELGLGLDVYYAKSSVEFTTQYTDTIVGTQTFKVQLDNPRPRFLFRADYHFLNSENVDFYAALGLGVNAAHFKFTTQDPIFNKNSLTLPGIIPVAFRLAIGTKVYPVPFLGIGAELGIGGPLLTVGLTGRF